MWKHGGCLESVQQVAHASCGPLECHDIGTWKCGQGWKALELFKQMQQEGVPPDSVTFLGFLSACASVLQLKHAGLLMNRPFKVVASQMLLWGMGSVTCMSNVEVWKYEDTSRVFNNLPSCDLVTWTTMLNGYAMHGHGEEALTHFEQMC